MFILGLIVGLLISILIIITIFVCKSDINRTISQAKNYLPIKDKGFFISPLTENEERREEKISNNKKLGLDTKLSELYDEN